MNTTKFEQTRKPFSFKDFSNLDDSSDMQYLIASMDRMFELADIKNIKRRALDLLELQFGSSVIEVGCGLGHDAEVLGKMVGSNGKVIAIDTSEAMVEEAKKRSACAQVSYRYGNANSLDYPDDTFSAGYADRLLVSQKNIEKPFSEIVRIVKRGGKVCITDIDVGSAVMHPYLGKLTDILLDRLREIIRNPLIGRQLPTLFKKFGLINIKVFADAYVIRSFELVNTMIDFPRMIVDLHNLKRITEDELQKLSSSLLQAEKNNDFLYSIILFTVVGEKN